MSKKTLVTLLAILTFCLVPLSAYAGMHFVGTTRFGFGSLEASANLAGFGNNAISVTLTATGSNMTAMCQNRGGNRAPGQNPLSVSVNQAQTVTADRNGKASVQFKVNLLPTARQAGCPNNNWTVTDLYGTLYVTMVATDLDNGNQASQNFVCTVNEAQRLVVCSQS
jgi:hypothetical protein